MIFARLDLDRIAQTVQTTLTKVQPKEATIEFGLELTMKEGVLTSFIVKGEGKANLKVTLKWVP